MGSKVNFGMNYNTETSFESEQELREALAA